MNYVKSFDLFGVPATQIPATPGSGAPTTATEGAVGCLYMDIDTGALYQCTAITEGAYTWVEVGSDKIPVAADVDDAGLVSFRNSAGLELFTLDLSGVSGASFGELVISTDSLEVPESGSNTFEVTLATAPSANQPVYLAVSDNTKISVSPNVLTFTSTNYAEPQTVTVTAVRDDDKNDENIVVTLTSRKVSAKQVSVVVTDNYYVPELVTDGLALNMDYLAQADNNTDIMVDSASGVSFSNFSYYTKASNGVWGNTANKSLVATTTDEGWANFVNAMKAGPGATFEHFGMTVYPAFQTTAGYMMQPGANYGFSAGETGVVSGTLSTKAIAVLQDGTTTAPGAVSQTFIIDDVSVNLGGNANWPKLPHHVDFIHLVYTLSPDGVFTVFLNGTKCATPVTVENFDHWDFEATFDKLSMYRVYSASEKNVMTADRIYNRALTHDEIVQNMQFTASRLGLSTF